MSSASVAKKATTDASAEDISEPNRATSDVYMLCGGCLDSKGSKNSTREKKKKKKNQVQSYQDPLYAGPDAPPEQTRVTPRNGRRKSPGGDKPVGFFKKLFMNTSCDYHPRSRERKVTIKRHEDVHANPRERTGRPPRGAGARPAQRKSGRESNLEMERVTDGKHTTWTWKPKKGGVYRPLARDRRISRGAKEEFYKTRFRNSMLEQLYYDPFKIYNFGERESGLHCPGSTPQDYMDIRNFHMENHSLFEDPQFPLEKAIYFPENSKFPKYDIVWKRPREFVKNPRMFVGGVSRFDVKQGVLGNCWFLAAVANLTMNPPLLFHVVPTDQVFDTTGYVGAFHFRFWQYGRWIDVCIDDRLPTREGQLLFMRSSDKNEFWSPLLEKAYAKLHGSYEAIAGGSLAEAMEDLTGGLAEQYTLKDSRPDLYQMLRNAYNRSGIIGCLVEPSPHKPEELTAQGLVKGHAYSITKMLTVTSTVNTGTKRKVDLIRVRNPWGNATKWQGDWCDTSNLWKTVSPIDRANLRSSIDGEFWMAYTDFLQNFYAVVICMINPQSMSMETVTKEWDLKIFEGSWVKGSTAGGCRNFLETFELNPQYRITVRETDKNDREGKTTIIVGLMQKNRRRLRAMGVEKLDLGYSLYQVKGNSPRPLNTEFFKKTKMFQSSASFCDFREITMRFRVSPGIYVFIPCTFSPDQQGDYLIRVFSQVRIDMHENEITVGAEQDIVNPSCNVDLKPFDPNAETKIMEKVDANEEMSWITLKQTLKDLASKRRLLVPVFENEIYRSFVALYDTCRVGRISSVDSLDLWSTIVKWTKIFQESAIPRKFLKGTQLRTAIGKGGLHIDFQLLNMMLSRYGDENGDINLEHFLITVVKLERLMFNFERAANNEDLVTMNLLHYLIHTMNC